MSYVTLRRLLPLGLLALALGCGEEPTTSSTVAPTTCLFDAQCAEGLVCLNQRCQPPADTCAGGLCPCQSSDTCPDGLVCDTGLGICTPPQCDEDAACQLGERCEGGRCVVDVNADRDRDGVPDGSAAQPIDTCPDTPNPEQTDTDGDGQGDACDRDDDNDGWPDADDSCPLLRNTDQADADQDGTGNLCDEDTPGATLTGRLVATAGVLDVPNTRLTLSGRDEPLAVNPDGSFAAPHVLTRAGLFALSVSSPGFIPRSLTWEVPGDVASFDVGTIALTAESQDGAAAALLQSSALLSGREDHSGILARASIGPTPVASTVTAQDGSFVLPLSRVNHTLSFEKSGFIAQTREIAWSEANARFELNGAALSEAPPVELLPIQDAILTGRLTSSIPVTSWTTIGAVTLFSERGELPAVIQPDGSFTLDTLAPGFYFLSVGATGHNDADRPINLDSGSNDIGLVELDPIFISVTETAKLRDQAEDNYGGITVRAFRGFDGVLADSTQTVTSGLFFLRLIPVDHRLIFSRPGYFDASVNLSWNEAAQEFRLGAVVLDPDDDDPLAQLDPVPRADTDGDGVIDAVDNCVQLSNPTQTNTDGDSLGDACDPDLDNDGVVNGLDNCPFNPNPAQEEGPEPGLGAVCTLGTAANPLLFERSILRLNVDTARRPNQLIGSCGGSGSGELVLRMSVYKDEPVEIDVAAAFGLVIYAVDAQGEEVFCRSGSRLEINAGDDPVALLPGTYTLVIDGFGFQDEGPLRVNALRRSGWHIPEGQLTSPDAGYDRAVEISTAQIRHAQLTQHPETYQDLPGNESRSCTTTSLGNGRDDGDCLRAHETGRLAQGDLNGDGLDDLLIANTATGNLFSSLETSEPIAQYVDLYVSTPTGYIWAPSFKPTGADIAQVAVADLNRDGHNDLAVLSRTLDISRLNPFDPNSFTLASYLDIYYGGPADPQRGLPNFAYGVDTRHKRITLHAVSGLAASFDVFVPTSIVLSDLDRDATRRPDAAILMRRLQINVDLASSPPFRVSPVTGQIFTRCLSGAGLYPELVPCPAQTTLIDGAGILSGNLKARDLDLDGFNDLIVAAYADTELLIYYGSAAGFGAPKRQDASYAPWDTDVIDIDYDGLPDIISSNEFGGRLEFFLQDANRDIAAVRLVNGLQNRDVTTTDLNQDGHYDLLISERSNNAEIVREMRPADCGGDDLYLDSLGLVGAYLARGDGRFEALPKHAFLHSSPSQVLDLDQDGNMDIVSATRWENWCANERRGLNFLYGYTQPLLERTAVTTTDLLQTGTFTRPTRVLGSDLDADCLTDLLVTNIGRGSFSIFRGDGQGGFGLEPAREVDLGIRALDAHLADVNQDGHIDFVGGGINSNQLNIIYGPLLGTAPLARTVICTQEPVIKGTDVEDLNGDGIMDVAVTAGSNIELLFGPFPLNNPNQTCVEPTTRYKIDTSPPSVSVYLRDINADGRPDLISASSLTNIDVFYNQPQVNTPGRAFPLPSGSAYGVLGCGDDLIRESDIDYPLYCRGEAVFNSTHRELSAPCLTITGGEVEDMNGDGQLDLAVSCIDTDNLVIFFGNTDPATRDEHPFASSAAGTPPPVEITGVPRPGQFGLTDMNGDGALDILVSQEESDALLVLHNSGDGEGRMEFTQALETGEQPVSAWAGCTLDSRAASCAVLEDQCTPERAIAVTANSSAGTLSIFGKKSPAFSSTVGTRLVDTARELEPCAPLTLEGTAVGGDWSFEQLRAGGERPCLVERLEVLVEPTAAGRASSTWNIELEAASLGLLTRSLPLLTREALPASTLWHAGLLRSLARFENTPAQGLWLLKTRTRDGDIPPQPALSRARLLINRQLTDPLYEEFPANPDQPSVCTTPRALAQDLGQDTLEEAQPLCGWRGEAQLEGTLQGGVSVRIALTGPGPGEQPYGGEFYGTWTSGTRLDLRVVGLPDGAEIAVRPVGSAHRLASGEAAGGEANIMYTVSEAFQRRYLVLDISPPVGWSGASNWTATLETGR